MSETQTETKGLAKKSEVDIIKDQLEKAESAYRELKIENNELKSVHAPQYAEMRLQLEMGARLVASKAFPNITPEQAFVILQAGKEMGLQPMESIKKLYIVNGRVGFHSDGLVSRLTEKGCKITYTDETETSVTVTITYKDETFVEVVKDTDQILQKSKAMGFAKKNKMRYHGVRMISSFYLPHLTGSVGVWDVDDIEAANEKKKDEKIVSLLQMIEACETKTELNELFENNKKDITKSLDLVTAYGKKKKIVQ